MSVNAPDIRLKVSMIGDKCLILGFPPIDHLKKKKKYSVSFSVNLEGHVCIICAFHYIGSIFILLSVRCSISHDTVFNGLLLQFHINNKADE